jgi:hypothetical protein
MRVKHTCINLVNVGSRIVEKYISIDLNYSHGILETLLFMYMQKYFPKYLNKRDSLMLFEFSGIFEFRWNNAPNDYTELAVNITPLLKSFFYHFLVEEDGLNLGEPPSLFKINDKIYLQVIYESAYPIEILSIIHQKDCPVLFEEIKDEYDIRSGLTKYKFKNADNTEFLLLPQFPDDLIIKIYNLYEHLLTIYKTIEFNQEQQREAKEVFDYLVSMQDFFNIPIKPE